MSAVVTPMPPVHTGAGNGAAPSPPPGDPTLGRGLGWAPELPDLRDFTPEHADIEPLLAGFGVRETALPAAVDLRKWCSPIEDQQTIGSCTAQAGVAIVEYYQRRAFDKHLEGSRLFVYKATRNLLGWTGDTGAYLRSTMGALTLFGVPPESYWPYAIARYDVEPPAFLYALGQTYQAERFYRLDPAGTSAADVLTAIKQQLAAGLPRMFGFTVYESIRQAASTGKIPYPARTDKVVGGHAVVAVGYDDAAKVTHAGTGQATTGALIIRNSWGTGWGEGGYGLLPYEYVRQRLAIDWWVLVKAEWLDQGAFQR